MSANRPIFKTILEQVKKTVLKFFDDEDVIIFLFGSSARGDSHIYSDIDIGILPRNGYNKKKFILLKEHLENMNIPYSIDLVDISKVSDTFKKNVLKEGKIWKS